MFKYNTGILYKKICKMKKIKELTTIQRQFLTHLKNVIKRKELNINNIISTSTDIYCSLLDKCIIAGYFPPSYFNDGGIITQENLRNIIKLYKQKFCTS